MQISGIANISTSTTGLATTPPQPKPAISSSSTAAPQTAPASTSTSSVPAKTSSSLAQISSSASSPQAATLAASYSTTVAGKSYSGSVEELGGTYVASVGNLLGASASGSSVQAAENNLNNMIDILA